MIKPVSGFSFLLGLGVAMGLSWALASSGERHAERTFNLGVAVLFAALIGSRAVYVALNWGYYRAQLIDSLWIWQGGFSAAGALLGGSLGLFLAAWYARLSPRWLGDQLLPLLVSLSVTGWLACWLAGCSYGPVSRAWWALPARDEWGVSDWRLPVQLLGALLTVAGFAFLHSKRALFRYPGLVSSLGLLLTASILFALSFLRADPMPRWSGLRADSWGALGVMLLAVCFGLFSYFSPHLEQI